MATKLRIVHKIDHSFKPNFIDVYDQMEAMTVRNWTVRGEWVGRDTFATFEEAKEALKYYDGTVEQFTVVWESP